MEAALTDLDHLENWSIRPSIPAAVKPMVRARLNDCVAALAPAPAEFVVTCLTRLAAHYPVDRTEAQWRIVFEDFVKDLAEMPADILFAVITEHRRTMRFFPSVSEIYGPATIKLEFRMNEIDCLRKLLDTETDEERADRLRHEVDRREIETQRLDRERLEAERAYTVANPHFRIWKKYWLAMRCRVKSLSEWYGWLALAVAEFGVDVVDAWHAEVIMRNSEEALEKLRELSQVPR